MGDRLGDHRLACPWRPVEQNPAWGFKPVGREFLAVNERQLDGIANLGDLLIQSADHLVGRLWNLGQLQA